MNGLRKGDKSVATVGRIAKNTGALFAAQVAGHVLSFFYMMYTARYLGPSNFGILAFAAIIAALLHVIVLHDPQPAADLSQTPLSMS